MKKLLTSVLALTLLCCICLTGCAPISRDDAEAMLKDFFTDIAEDDYEAAVSYMHPVNNLDADGLCDTVTDIESDAMCDFSNGLELGRCLSYYTSTNFNTNGISGLYTALTLKHEVRIGNQDFILESDFVNDGSGILISGFKLIVAVYESNGMV